VSYVYKFRVNWLHVLYHESDRWTRISKGDVAVLQTSDSGLFSHDSCRHKIWAGVRVGQKLPPCVWSECDFHVNWLHVSRIRPMQWRLNDDFDINQRRLRLTRNTRRGVCRCVCVGVCHSFPPQQTASAMNMANAVALNWIGWPLLLSWQLPVQHRLGRHWHHVSACQGKQKQRIRQAATEIMGWTWHILEDESRRVSSRTQLASLLYASDLWTLYRRHVLKLYQFHLRCLRKIAGIKWQNRTTNVEVLQTCKISGMEALLLQAQYRWAGHLVRMNEWMNDVFINVW